MRWIVSSFFFSFVYLHFKVVNECAMFKRRKHQRDSHQIQHTFQTNAFNSNHVRSESAKKNTAKKNNVCAFNKSLLCLRMRCIYFRSLAQSSNCFFFFSLLSFAVARQSFRGLFFLFVRANRLNNRLVFTVTMTCTCLTIPTKWGLCMHLNRFDFSLRAPFWTFGIII